jgi:hypothetical protein
MKRILLIGLAVIILLSIYFMVQRSMPYQEVMQTQGITIDSFIVTGPVVLIFDRPSRQNFWLKSYTSFHAKEFDSLRGKAARVHYMKTFVGPFENRIFKLEIDSVVVFDQVIEAKKPGR